MHAYLTILYRLKFRLKVKRVKKDLSKSTRYIRIESKSSIKQFYIVFVINKISQLLTQHTIFWEINEIFPYLSNTRVSFFILFTTKTIYDFIDFRKIFVHNTISGNRIWFLQLFINQKKGVYQIQVGLKKGLGIPAYCILVCHIVKSIVIIIVEILQDSRI